MFQVYGEVDDVYKVVDDIMIKLEKWLCCYKCKLKNYYVDNKFELFGESFFFVVFKGMCDSFFDDDEDDSLLVVNGFLELIVIVEKFGEVCMMIVGMVFLELDVVDLLFLFFKNVVNGGVNIVY